MLIIRNQHALQIYTQLDSKLFLEINQLKKTVQYDIYDKIRNPLDEPSVWRKCITIPT